MRNMCIMKINPINQSESNTFNGKFIVKGNISKENKELLELFKSCREYNSRSNKKLLKSKPYDIFAKEIQDKDGIFLSAGFTEFHLPGYYEEYSENILHLDQNSKDKMYQKSSMFDLYLDEFEKRKEAFKGFNNRWEKIKLILKYYIID